MAQALGPPWELYCLPLSNFNNPHPNLHAESFTQFFSGTNAQGTLY